MDGVATLPILPECAEPMRRRCSASPSAGDKAVGQNRRVPEGCGQFARPTSSGLLADALASPSPPFLADRPNSLATRPRPFLRQAPRPYLLCPGAPSVIKEWAVRRAAPRPASTIRDDGERTTLVHVA